MQTDVVTEPQALSVPPLTILLLGGVASGKSTVAGLLAERGARVLDADKIAHEVLAEPDVTAAVAERFGDGVLEKPGVPDGVRPQETRVSRKSLAEEVFTDPAKLKALEAIVHPRVIQRIMTRLGEMATRPGEPRRVAVLDVPLALEASRGAGLMEACDLRLFVEASVETRRSRALKLRGWAEGELERREARQLSPEEKRARADFVVRNDGEVSEVSGDVERFWSALVRPRLEAGVG